MTSKLKLSSLIALLLGGILCFLAPGCRNLAPEGAYQGDKALYETDLAITTSYDVIHTFVSWEKENRAAVAQWPEIRKGADAMRANAKTWFASAYTLRDAYALNPTPENKSKLDAALRVLRAALTEAAQYMATAAAPQSQPKP